MGYVQPPSSVRNSTTSGSIAQSDAPAEAVHFQTEAELIQALRERVDDLIGQLAVARECGRRRAVEKFYTVAEVALLLSFSDRWVRDRCRAGEFPNVISIDGDVRIPAGDVNALLEASRREDLGVLARSKGELLRRVRNQRGRFDSRESEGVAETKG